MTDKSAQNPMQGKRNLMFYKLREKTLHAILNMPQLERIAFIAEIAEDLLQGINCSQPAREALRENLQSTLAPMIKSADDMMWKNADPSLIQKKWEAFLREGSFDAAYEMACRIADVTLPPQQKAKIIQIPTQWNVRECFKESSENFNGYLVWNFASMTNQAREKSIKGLTDKLTSGSLLSEEAQSSLRESLAFEFLNQSRLMSAQVVIANSMNVAREPMGTGKEPIIETVFRSQAESQIVRRTCELLAQHHRQSHQQISIGNVFPDHRNG